MDWGILVSKRPINLGFWLMNRDDMQRMGLSSPFIDRDFYNLLEKYGYTPKNGYGLCEYKKPDGTLCIEIHDNWDIITRTQEQKDL